MLYYWQRRGKQESEGLKGASSSPATQYLPPPPDPHARLSLKGEETAGWEYEATRKEWENVPRQKLSQNSRTREGMWAIPSFHSQLEGAPDRLPQKEAKGALTKEWFQIRSQDPS